MPGICVLSAMCVYYIHHEVLVKDRFRGGHVYILHITCDKYLVSSGLYECIVHVNRRLNYDIGSCAHMKLTNGPKKLSNNTSATHINVKFKLTCTVHCNNFRA